uniref:OTU domain-containing protein n=1 Tax=viral metagenome TaxID=1070528 RepID=A0A6C0D4V1_9ZZZZ
MINSNLKKEVRYNVTNNIDKSDLDKEAYVYNAKIYNKHIKFVLGAPNFEHLNSKIIFFNIYLVNNGSIVSKIGIYETNNSDYNSLLDHNGDIDLNKLSDPIMFPYSKSLIMNNYDLIDDFETMSNAPSEVDTNTSMDTDNEEEDEEEEEETASEASTKSSINYNVMTLISQSKEESDYEIANYEEDPKDTWVNKYLRSNKYEIIDNEGAGDCFFAVLRDALKTVKIETSVKSIREKLANEVDQTIFQTYKELFDLYYNNMKTTQEQLKTHKNKHNTLKKMITGTSDGPDKIKLIQDAKDNFNTFTAINTKGKELEDLAREFQFMKDVNSVEDLKKVIKEVGGAYWADNWALSSLERIYNVKFIILSQTHYVEGEKEHVLQCISPDIKLEERGLFEPSYYIMADYYQNNHYKLITYDKNIKRGALTFSEVPYKIKELILERCMEKNAGLYVLIPDFKTFANKHGVETTSISKKSAYDTLVDTKKPKSQDYDDSIVIQIYNKSKHAKVGEGSGESIKPELKISKNVLELNNKKKYPEWRKKLDNEFLVTNLKIDGINWTSVKHYMLASRFNGITDIISKFKKDGVYGSNIEEAQKFYESQLAKKSIKSTLINDEEFKKMEHTLLEKALYAKFTQNDELRELLLLTGNALITLFKPSKGAIPFVELMKVRKLITK